MRIVVFLLGGIVGFGCLEAAADYTPLTYIKATGKQWINTGYTPACTDKIELKVKFTTVETTQCLYCSRGTSWADSSFSSFLTGKKRAWIAMAGKQPLNIPVR